MLLPTYILPSTQSLSLASTEATAVADNSWLVYRSTTPRLLLPRILARHQACHLTFQLKISSMNLRLADQSESRILNPFMGLVTQPQIHGGNFEIGQLTSMIP